jgi:hypothetical protein
MKIVIIIFLILCSCSSSKQASYKERKGLMLLETGEYHVNKNKYYHQSNTVKKVQKKNKSLLKRTYKK